MSTAKILYYAIISLLGLGLVGITFNYARGLRGSPRELWLLYGYKFTELTGYKLVALSAVLWLSYDCGMSDKSAGDLYSGYSILASAMGVVVGALIDAAGIRKVMLASIALLFVGRFTMIWTTGPILSFILGLAPMALGFAMVSPLTSVAIKRYTTAAGSTYGFSLFYVLMNLAFTCGNSLYDKAIQWFSLKDAEGKIINQSQGLTVLGHQFSTYQLIFGGACIATLFSLLMTLPIREGVEREESGEIKITPPKLSGSIRENIRNATLGTVNTIRAVAGQRFLWVFLGMIGILMFVKSVFIQWDMILPKYCPRIMGEGAKVGAINNVNTILILFFVPLMTVLTAKVRSYKLMMIGAAISTAACFITALPDKVFAPITHTIIGEVVFVHWLKLAPDATALVNNPPSPFYWSLFFSFLVFTLGEAIWSPRFYQFTAEIAPKGREATYLSLAILPTFASKIFVGPLSGRLLDAYVPVSATGEVLPHPNHYMIWIWIGLISAATPVGMLLYKKFFERETLKLTGENASAL